MVETTNVPPGTVRDKSILFELFFFYFNKVLRGLTDHYLFVLTVRGL